MTNLTRRPGWRALAVAAGASLALLAAACGDDDSSSDTAPTTAAAQATTAPSVASTAACRDGREARGRQVVPDRPDRAARRVHRAVQGRRRAVLHARPGRGRRPVGAVGQGCRDDGTAGREAQAVVGRRQPAVRADGGHRRRRALAEPVRRHHRRRLERAGRPRERGAVRSDPAGRLGRQAARRLLQHHGGRALGHAPGLPAAVDAGRPGRRRHDGVRRGAARLRRSWSRRPGSSTATPRSCRRRPRRGSRSRATRSRPWS